MEEKEEQIIVINWPFSAKHRNSSVKQCIIIQFIHLVNGFYLLLNTHLSLFIETSFKLYN